MPTSAAGKTALVDAVLAQPEGSAWMLMAPVVRGRKGEYKKEIAALAQKGFQRIRIDGELYDIEDAPDLDKKFKHDIEVVVDRVVVGEGLEARLADSLEIAAKLIRQAIILNRHALKSRTPARARELRIKSQHKLGDAYRLAGNFCDEIIPERKAA